MKKRIIVGAILALVLVTTAATVIYQWPIHQERTYEHVALWYAYEGEERTGGFVEDYTTVCLSITRKRKLTAPDVYEGTITLGEKKYTLSDHDYGGFFDTWKRKFEEGNKISLSLTAEISAERETDSGVTIPVSTDLVDLYIRNDFASFVLMESLEINSGKLNVYAYPASSEEEAQTVYESLHSS